MSNNNGNIENPYQTLYENLMESHKSVIKTLENMSYIMKQSSSPSLSSTPSSSLLSSSLLSSSSSSSSSSSPTKVNNIMPIPIRTIFTPTPISAFAFTSTSTSISTSTFTSTSTLAPTLTLTPTPTSTSMSSRHSSFSMSPLPSCLYTSGNTLLSKENGNWIVSYGSTSSTMV